MQKKFLRTNQQIKAESLRVIGIDGKQIGILKKDQALKLAEDYGVDLVEIAPAAKPPVARILDFKKFIFAQEIKERLR